MALVVLGKSFQPSICWRVRIQTALSTGGTPNQPTYRAVMSLQPSSGAGRKPRLGKCWTQEIPEAAREGSLDDGVLGREAEDAQNLIEVASQRLFRQSGAHVLILPAE
jgi:hypothetical protein